MSRLKRPPTEEAIRGINWAAAKACLGVTREDAIRAYEARLSELTYERLNPPLPPLDEVPRPRVVYEIFVCAIRRGRVEDGAQALTLGAALSLRFGLEVSVTKTTEYSTMNRHRVEIANWPQKESGHMTIELQRQLLNLQAEMPSRVVIPKERITHSVRPPITFDEPEDETLMGKFLSYFDKK